MLALFAGHASASNPVIDGEPQDFWFTYTEPAVLTVRTYAVQGFMSDPMLWLYDDQGVLLASNDDWFGLQSFIELPVQAGSYRVRAGWCCGDPNAVRPGWRYEVSTSVAPVSTTVETSTSLQEPTTTIVDSTYVSTTVMQETSTTTTSTVPQTTTTQEPTTTIQNVAPSTTDPVPSTSDLPATSLPPTTLQESTTTSDEPSTTTLPVSEPIPTTTVLETILSTTLQESTTTLTTLPPKPQATTPQQTSTTTPTTPPATSTSVTPLTTAPPETLETTTTTSPGEILPNILTTPDQLADAVEQADTPAERAVLTAQLNVAPDDTKRTFEATVNVYNGQWDTYVPAGSRIPVGERRTLIAVMGGLVSLLSTAPRRKN